MGPRLIDELREITGDEDEVTIEVTVPVFTFDEMLFDTEFTNNIENAHLLPHEEAEAYFTCHVCYKRYASRLYLLLHQACHLAQGTLDCKFCQKSFHNMEDFTDHVDQHIANTCFTCEMSFLYREELVEHQKSHEDLSRYLYICNICKEHFPNQRELQLHGRRHFSTENQCDTCGKYFSSKSNLNRHMPTHQNVKSFVCELCNDRFTQKISLQRHYLMHANIKPFPCNICGQGFTLKSALNAHRLKHEFGQKPFECLICDCRFANKRMLKKHTLEHMPGQVSPCDLCGKEFPSKEKLNLHFMTHTNMRPYQCDICKRGFTYSSHLKRHMLLHTGRKDFPGKERIVEIYRNRHRSLMQSAGMDDDTKNWMFCE